MFLCRELAKETFQTIAEKFNKKDHTTVIAADGAGRRAPRLDAIREVARSR